jgi:hypothetical protein
VFVGAAACLQAGIYFEPNRGQAGARVSFLARTPRGSAAIFDNGAELVRADGTRASYRWEGSSGEARGCGEELAAGVSHYAIHRDPARWVWNVPHYSRVRVPDLYPGIDLLYHAARGELEFDLLVAPGADPGKVALIFAEPARIQADGSVILGGAALRAPRAWQTVGAERVAVDAQFRFAGRDRVQFALGPYDRKLPLVIDPVVEFATYMGGLENEGDTRIAAGEGAIFVAGTTISADFPASSPERSVLNRPVTLLAPDVYVARMKPDGSALEWSLYAGGNGGEAALGLKLDEQGNLYLLGATLSPDFPVTPGAYRGRIHKHLSDLFVMKLDARTGRIAASTFLGAAQRADIPRTAARLAVDRAGSVFVAGFVYDDGFQTTPGAYRASAPKQEPQATLHAHRFALRLDTALTAPGYATFLDAATINAVDVDSGGNLWLGGVAAQAPFPAVHPIPGVNQRPEFPAQAYVAKLNDTGTAVLFASLVHGGGRFSSILDLKAAPDGSIHIAGYGSGGAFPQVDPLAVNPAQTGDPSRDDPAPFLAKLAADRGDLLQSTLLRGPQYLTSPALAFPAHLRLTLQPDWTPCLLGLGAPNFEQTPGGLSGRARPHETPNHGGTLACVDVTGDGFSVKTMLPEGAEYTETVPLPDGSILLAGVAGNSFRASRNSFQPRFGGGVMHDQFYPFALPYGDAFVMRVSLGNPVPKVNAIAPEAMLLETALLAPRAVDVYGSGFAHGAEVTLNGKPVSSLFVDANHISLPSVDFEVIQAGPNTIRVSLPGPGGGASERVFAGVNPAPGMPSMTPASVTQGSGEARVVIRATNITAQTTLYWDGEPRAAQYVLEYGRSGRLELLLASPEVAEPRGIRVTIANPGPGGGRSLESFFTVRPASGESVPVLTGGLTPVPLGDSARRVEMVGSGFTSATRVFWDGVEVPVETASATRIAFEIGGDLARWGGHDVYVVNERHRSNTARQFIGCSVASTHSAIDASRNRLYLISAPRPSGRADLLIVDLHNGDLLAAVPEIVAGGRAIAVSVNGRYVFVAGGSGTGAITRYDTEAGTVDLEWRIRLSSFGYEFSMLPVPGSPETLAVSSPPGDVTIFDGKQRRGTTAAATGVFPPAAMPVFATASRIYLRGSEAGCWQWLEFDGSGITSASEPCSTDLPTDAVRDGGVVYLTDGERSHVVSLFEAPSSFSTPFWPLLVDPARRRAYRVTSNVSGVSQAVGFNLDNQEQQIGAQLRLNAPYGGAAHLAGDGSVVIVGPTVVTLWP